MTSVASTATEPAAEPKVLVINHEARLIHATLPTKSGTPEVHTFKPGANAIERDLWDAVRETKIIQRCLADETMTVHSERGADVKAMKVIKAVEVIKVTFDRAMLARWAEDDKRGAVQKAIKAQIAALDDNTPAQ